MHEGRFITARDIIFGPEYIAGAEPIAEALDEFYAAISARIDAEVEQALANAAILELMMQIMAVLMPVIGIGAFAVILRSIKPINGLMALVSDVFRGSLNINIDRSRVTKDEIGVLTLDIYNLVELIKRMTDDLQKFTRIANEEGDLEYRIDSSKYDGTYREMIDSVNKFIDGFVSDMMRVLSLLDEVGSGDFSAQIPAMPGKKVILNHKFDALMKNLKDVSSNIDTLAQDAAQGKLDGRVDSSRFQGDWKKSLDSLNDLMSAVSEPLSEIENSVREMSKGNFVKMQGNYKGSFDVVKKATNSAVEVMLFYIKEISDVLDSMSQRDLTVMPKGMYTSSYAPIKEALIKILDSLNNSMLETESASAQVLAGAEQISGSAMHLAEGSQRQSSSVQELTSVITMINDQTRSNAERANEADELSQKSNERAKKGNNEMKGMVSSMQGIKESSDSIFKIIKGIEDIAFQTNLLALNAAVEAARAGEYGKGFAVVADEVRSLASRSQSAAKETTGQIEDSIGRVNDGMSAAQDTSGSLFTIVEDVQSVSDLIKQITILSKDQTEAISQIYLGINEISGVVQDISATREQCASASQQLNSQAENLRQMISFFKLRTQ
ncbi:MAG: methyl-accepting chemotaxis protein [Defluviitaleaceae bacterium]|nr:methyl-accepting chemotaxis protein [Defluviitaleaceae bacterium]